jgi:hypothetical protein
MPMAAMPIDKTEQILATLRQRAAVLERLNRGVRRETPRNGAGYNDQPPAHRVDGVATGNGAGIIGASGDLN